MFHHTALSIGFAVLLGGADNTQDKWLERTIPSAPPMIIIEGARQRPLERVERRLTFKRRVSLDGRAFAPEDLGELVEMVRSGLPPEYLRDLAAHYGFAPKVGRESYSTEDLRLPDLQAFLADEFELFDQATPVGRQVSCMSPGEGSLLPLIALVVRREVADTYKPRLDMPADMNRYAVFAVAERLAYVCGAQR